MNANAQHSKVGVVTFFDFGEAPLAARSGKRIIEVVCGTQQQVADAYAARHVAAVKGALLFGTSDVYEWAIMANWGAIQALQALHGMYDLLRFHPTIGDREGIAEPFVHFPVGTPKADVLEWMAQCHPRFNAVNLAQDIYADTRRLG